MVDHDKSVRLPARIAEARDRILDAALRIFSVDGLAGARTERLRHAAGVNKALLYYYFESKEKLYPAALEDGVSGFGDRSMAADSAKPVRGSGCCARR